ncbi:DNA-binding CsgD family transcriptional regulator/ligand-binding sensor domain-containing protein [Flavobacterium arsenatis]|uniref:DNA-binding CsgD family transcriptional regulator/ligand-binding sensor domain-containing protein n=1 Tax=Flavobacterium arsenatis TaxID=1484332 RepID=A0ABU1TLM5_9FLAO|nr:triple tyrosine motif-containing protein [Flavobacterium arsenatis]MDR6966865.1 DNA-binding CsgD family transcriptional regulator/ligand-binding sensor domain-containing protein [Flavobacterium arsenatis]
MVNGQVKNIGLPEINNYKKSDYKGGTQNWGIDQDANGNLYFANNSGLLKFDGSSWSEYNIPNNSSIRSLKVGGSNKIYAGGYNEFGYFEPNEKGKLLYHSVSKLVNENNRHQIDFIWKIHQFKNEIIYQAFEKAYIYNGKTLKLIEAPGKFQFSFVVNDRLYFQDSSFGLMEYVNGKLVVLPGTMVLNNTEVWGIFPLSKTKMLVTTLDKGLFVYENNILTQWETEANAFMKKNSCLGGVEIQKKFIALNSVLDGVVITDLEGNILQHINRKKGMQNNTVLSSFIDSKNNLWLGLDNGITFINESSPFTYFGFSYGISTVYASVVHNNNLYVATNQGLFYHSWGKTFKEDSFELVQGTTGQAWNIQVIDGQLFCGHNRGMLQVSGNKVVKTLDSNGYWSLKKIPNQPNLLIGSNYSGFAIFQKIGNEWSFRNYIEGMTKSASTYEIEDQNVWLKKDEFLYQMKLSNDFMKFKSIKTYQNLSPTERGIASIQKINNRIYFQNNNHFYRYSAERDLFFEDKQMSVLFKDLPMIRSSFQDKIGNIWYIYNESIGVLKKDNETGYENILAPFSNLTGNILFDYLSINTIDSRNIFIGMTDGLAHYDPELLNNFSSKPKAFIRSFSFPSDTLIVGNIPKNKVYEIPYQSNNVKFTFSSPTYENLANVEFSYKLEGFDENWSNWTTVSMKEYTNLREDDYCMKVRVRNSYGVISEPAEVAFTVRPPFYRHFLAYIFYLMAIVGIVYLIRQRIKMKIRKNKYYETIEQRRLYLEKEAKIRQEQFELEKEIERLKNDKLKIKILAKDKELVNNSLQVVKKNKILNGIIHKLKDIDVENMDDSVKFQFGKLNKSIVKEVNADKSWKDLEKHIKNVHFDFLKRLKEKYPTISPRELDLSTYLLMNMSTKEIAEIMNISSGGVELARYRLRKKLELNKKENLIGFLMSI